MKQPVRVPFFWFVGWLVGWLVGGFWLALGKLRALCAINNKSSTEPEEKEFGNTIDIGQIVYQHALFLKW